MVFGKPDVFLLDSEVQDKGSHEDSRMLTTP